MDTNGASPVDYQAKSFQIALANLSQFHASECTTHLAITWEPPSTSFFLLTSSSTPPKHHQLLLPVGISPPKQDASPHATQTCSSNLTHAKFASHTACLLTHWFLVPHTRFHPPHARWFLLTHGGFSSHNAPILPFVHFGVPYATTKKQQIRTKCALSLSVCILMCLDFVSVF